MDDVRLILATAPRPGALAILQLLGDVEPVLREISGKDDWPVGCTRLATFSDIDEGMVVRLRDDVAELIPHGGMRVQQRLIAWLQTLGIELVESNNCDPMDLFPEAEDELEAIMLHALSRAQSPLAVELLLDQPRRWREVPAETAFTDQDHARWMRLNRLINPPHVVVCGQANVGKSTLSNALMGRALSLEADMPGTTRDYTAGRLDLAGLVVDWHDTAGLRSTDDPVETRAIELSRHLMAQADLLIALTDAEHDWPDLPRSAELRVANKSDLAARSDADLNISALTGEGMAEFVSAVRDRLVFPTDLTDPSPWRFDERLPV